MKKGKKSIYLHEAHLDIVKIYVSLIICRRKPGKNN